MDTSPEKEETKHGTASIGERVALINNATNGLFEAIVGQGRASQDPLPPHMQNALTHALTLANCGLVALAEIADAQQRMARLAEIDMDATIAGAIDEAAELKVAAKEAETTKRSFIGQRKKKNSG